jgi:hypothetical protein
MAEENKPAANKVKRKKATTTSIRVNPPAAADLGRAALENCFAKKGLLGINLERKPLLRHILYEILIFILS